MSINWVMMNQEGEIVKLHDEKIYYKVRSRISLEITTPKALRNASPFLVKSDSGILYLTTHRVIYIPARPTDELKSFATPVLSLEDTHPISSLFGPWSWGGLFKPTDGGGFPPDVPRMELKLVFREGGMDTFVSKFNTLKERLHHAREIMRETGQALPVGEDLPAYSAQGVTAGPSSQATPRTEAAPQQTAQSSTGTPPQTTQPTPDEPPPDYEEAQAQAIGMGLEHRQRELAERE